MCFPVTIENAKDKYTNLINSLKARVKAEKEKKDAIQTATHLLEEKYLGLTKIVKDVEEYIKIVDKAKARADREVKRASEAKNERLKATSEVESIRRERELKTKDLEEMKEYLYKLSSRLSTRAEELREVTDFINKELKEYGVPVEYEQISEKIKVPFK